MPRRFTREASAVATTRHRGIGLTFSQSLGVLMEACDVPAEARGAFEARVRQLQRLGLPQRSPEQRMARMRYGIVELAMLATAFRLMAAFVIPTLAVRYLTERWTDLAPAMLAGAGDALPTDYLLRRSVTAGPIVLIEGHALADLGQKGRLDERNTGPLGRIKVASADAPDLPKLVGGVGIMLDTRTYMPRIVGPVAALTLATDAELTEELDRLRFAD